MLRKVGPFNMLARCGRGWHARWGFYIELGMWRGPDGEPGDNQILYVEAHARRHWIELGIGWREVPMLF